MRTDGKQREGRRAKAASGAGGDAGRRWWPKKKGKGGVTAASYSVDLALIDEDEK